MPDLVGQSIGRYHVVEELGTGGMATVYKVYDTRLERDAAIKIIRREVFSPEVMERMLKRFEREGKALARMMHPNIVSVYDYGEYEGSPYLVMAYISGGTLKERTGTPLPYKEAARILAPIARALEYAHKRGVVHRDVKPVNILISEMGEPMLSDFGIAKILEGDETGTLTGVNVGVGTPEYMAPEQGLGKEVDGRADIYSLGVVLYELVTGRKPYTADTPVAVILKHISDPLPRPCELVTDLPEDVEKVIFKALAKKPEDRFQSMSEFGAALERMGWKDGNVAAPIVSLGVRRAKEKNPPWWVWTIAGLLGLAVLGVLWGKSAGWLSGPSARAVEFTQAATEDHTQVPVVTEVISPTVTLTEKPTQTATPNATVTPTLGIGAVKKSEKDGMEMVYVPEGDFLMGSEYGEADERPVHTVYLNAYWIDKYEVTNGMYEQCVADGKCLLSSRKNDSNFMGSLQPIVGIDWNNANAYCQWSGRRLPSEAEWEKAARGTEGKTYPWGNETPSKDLLNMAQSGDGYENTAPVGSFPKGASPYGAMDMAGNVWEWTADWYGVYSSGRQENPQGPSSGDGRVLRGGSWYEFNGKRSVRSTCREWEDPTSWGYHQGNGFRCATSE
jgi:serine/threonine protein kinase